MTDTTAGEGVFSLPSRDGDVTSIAQAAQCIIMNVEDREGWADDGGLVTIRCHAEVIRDDALALAAQPSAGAQGEALWAMHIRGPDDLYPAPDYDTAVKWCDYVNYNAAPRSPDVIMAAVPTIWPYEPEGHKDGLAGSVADWTLPRNADGTEQVIRPLFATPAQPDTGDVAALREALEKVKRRIKPHPLDITLDREKDVQKAIAIIDAALSKPNAPGREG